MKAVNTYGSSTYSIANINSIQVQIAPTLDVTTVTLEKTRTSITAAWTTSPTTQAGTGYAAITHYRYRHKLTSGTFPADWIASTQVTASASHSITISSLLPKTQYDFQVIAVNQFGNGPETPAVTYSITTSDVPDAPAAPTIALTSSGTSVNISFVAPAAHNSSINGYSLKFEKADGTFSTVSGVCVADMTTTLACNNIPISTLLTNTNRANGDEIKVKVVASNAEGSSSDSPSSSSSVVYASIPISQVAGLAATTISATQIDVSWTL